MNKYLISFFLIVIAITSAFSVSATGPTKCQPGWSALVHLVYNTTSGNMPNACANTACWPINWQMIKTYPGSATIDCWFLNTCNSTSFMYRTMSGTPSSWQTLPQCPSVVTAGPWHSP